jgi:hypothetical protein
VVGTATYVGAADARALPPLEAQPYTTPREIPLFMVPGRGTGVRWGGTELEERLDPGSSAPALAWVDAPPTGQNWEGLNNIDGVYPPDTVGDVGPNHYVQMVNMNNVQVWDKTGAPLGGFFKLRSLWPGGDVCNTSPGGDPIVLYDPLADRWLLSQMMAPGAGPPFYECIAISQTPDPTGFYWTYSFPVHATKFNDYPKFGVWPDGYYMSANQYDVPAGWAWGGVGL